MSNVDKIVHSYQHIWKTKSSYFSWLRGVLRAGWSKSPIKLDFIKSKRIKINNPNPRGRVKTVWGGKCSQCKQDFILKDLQVDHMKPCGSLIKEEDIQCFVERLLLCTGDDLQFTCKPCHGIITYAEKQGISYEEAAIRKKAISICKEDDKLWLEQRGITPASNATKRRQQVMEVLKNEDST